MLIRGLRLAVTFLCVAGLAVAPAGAGDGSAAGRIGGAANETAGSWFVELASPPAVKGTSKATLKAERDAFKTNAAADGVKLTEHYSYDTLWNGLSVSVPPAQVAALGSIPGVKAVYPVETVSLPAYRSEGGGGADIELKNALGLTGANIAQNELGLDGSGVTIAIVDSGVDYTLPELGGCFGPSCKVRGGLDDDQSGLPAGAASWRAAPSLQSGRCRPRRGAGRRHVRCRARHARGRHRGG